MYKSPCFPGNISSSLVVVSLNNPYESLLRTLLRMVKNQALSPSAGSRPRVAIWKLSEVLAMFRVYVNVVEAILVVFSCPPNCSF